MTKLIFISILIIFTGCVKREVVYMQNSNSSYYNNSSSTKSTNNSKHSRPSQYKKNNIIKKNTHTKKIDTCETEITKVFNSKASGKITICKGKILTDGQKSKIIYVNK